MGKWSTGTVGFQYRDWVGSFYPKGASVRRQLQLYAKTFTTCELTQYTHQVPDKERVELLLKQISPYKVNFFIRLHQVFTHHADLGMAVPLAKHFREAFEPMVKEGMFAGFVLSFPYIFKETPARRQYLEQVQKALGVEKQFPLQLDFRHPSWLSEDGLAWAQSNGLGVVCVDEPALPGLMPRLTRGTASTVLVRLHGRNAQSWWSGNETLRHDYLYSKEELLSLAERYKTLESAENGYFLFQNHWQAKAVHNALTWKEEVWKPKTAIFRPLAEPSLNASLVASGPSCQISLGESSVNFTDEDDVLRAPRSASIDEVRDRVKSAFSDLDSTFESKNSQIEMSLSPEITENLAENCDVL